MIPFGFFVACAALGALRLLRLTVPPRTDLLTGVGRWDLARARATRQSRLPSAERTLLGKVANRLVEELLRRGRDLSAVNQDLAITGSTLERHVARLLTLSALGLLGPIVMVTVLRAAGLELPTAYGFLAGVLLAGTMLVITQRELREDATTRRAEFRRSLSIYLDLVAMSMEAGRGHSEALPAAADIGSGWTFTHLQDAISGAWFAGVTPWWSLGRLGERIGMPELVDLEGALTLAAEDGARVRATLVARAQTLRAQRLADAGADAARATESMRFALIVMVFAFLAYELYPSVVRLFAG